MPRGRKLGSGYIPLDKQEILHRYFTLGESVIEISRDLRVSDATLYNRFSEWGVKSKRKKKTNGRK